MPKEVPVIDPAQFRSALSNFATGVTVVTTCDNEGCSVGMTVNSFSSVSLDPPLILWSVAKDALGYDIFVNAKYFAIQVLNENQETLSDLFSQRGVDKFAQLEVTAGLNGVPLLSEYVSCFQCQIEHRYPGGDHVILVARVLAFDSKTAKPLIFHKGGYTRLQPKK